MSWYMGDLPQYIPICHRKREEPFAMDCEIEAWSFQTLIQDFGVGVKPWVIEAAKTRKLAMHFYVPGTRIERLWDHQRDLWHKAWRDAAKYLQFSFGPEPDVWWDVRVPESRRLQYMAMALGDDMRAQGLPLIFVMLETDENNWTDQRFYINYANKRKMRWVATNLQGARNNTLFREALEVMGRYHQHLRPDLGIVINGVGAEKRIRSLLRVFAGREVVFSSNGRIERFRRAL